MPAKSLKVFFIRKGSNGREPISRSETFVLALCDIGIQLNGRTFTIVKNRLMRDMTEHDIRELPQYIQELEEKHNAS